MACFERLVAARVPTGKSQLRTRTTKDATIQESSVSTAGHRLRPLRSASLVAALDGRGSRISRPAPCLLRVLVALGGRTPQTHRHGRGDASPPRGGVHRRSQRARITITPDDHLRGRLRWHRASARCGRSFWRRFSTRVSPCYRHVSSLNSWRCQPWPMRFCSKSPRLFGASRTRSRTSEMSAIPNVSAGSSCSSRVITGESRGRSQARSAPDARPARRNGRFRARDGNARDRSAREGGLPHPRGSLLPAPHSPGSTGTVIPVLSSSRHATRQRRRPLTCRR